MHPAVTTTTTDGEEQNPPADRIEPMRLQLGSSVLSSFHNRSAQRDLSPLPEYQNPRRGTYQAERGNTQPERPENGSAGSFRKIKKALAQRRGAREKKGGSCSGVVSQKQYNLFRRFFQIGK
jgi:hypothetical protein